MHGDVHGGFGEVDVLVGLLHLLREQGLASALLREQGEEIVEFVEYLRLVSVVGLRLVFVRLVLCAVYVFVVCGGGRLTLRLGVLCDGMDDVVR